MQTTRHSAPTDTEVSTGLVIGFPKTMGVIVTQQSNVTTSPWNHYILNTIFCKVNYTDLVFTVYNEVTSDILQSHYFNIIITILSRILISQCLRSHHSLFPLFGPFRKCPLIKAPHPKHIVHIYR